MPRFAAVSHGSADIFLNPVSRLHPGCPTVRPQTRTEWHPFYSGATLSENARGPSSEAVEQTRWIRCNVRTACDHHRLIPRDRRFGNLASNGNSYVSLVVYNGPTASTDDAAGQ